MRAGQLKKGESLQVFPSKRTCVLRSIQISDVDQIEAQTNKRVGLALRGLLPKDVERGYILSNNISWTIASSCKVRLKLNPYSKLPEVGKTRHLIAGLQSVPTRIEEVLKDEKDPSFYYISLKLEQEIVYHHNEIALLIDLNGTPKTIGCCEFE